MSSIHLLYRRDYKINDNIRIVIPTVGEVLEDEDSYYNLVFMLTSMPVDMIVQLEDAGIDFTKINEYELFLKLFPVIQQMDTRLIFGDLDLSSFQYRVNQENGMVVLYDQEKDIMIDRGIQGQISATLRRIHNLEKNRKRPANDEAKTYMIDRARKKARRKSRKTEFSQLESLIISLVNTEQFKYDFEGIKELSIYQLNESARQVSRKIDYDNRMYGVYAGTIDARKLSRDELSWHYTHK